MSIQGNAVINTALRWKQNYSKWGNKVTQKFHEDFADLTTVISLLTSPEDDQDEDGAILADINAAIKELSAPLAILHHATQTNGPDTGDKTAQDMIRKIMFALSGKLAPYVPYFYMIMRTDLASLNVGKGYAQAGHVANQMVYQAQAKIAKGDEALKGLLDVWQNEALGFGTCITLAAPKPNDLYGAIKRANMDKLHAGIMHDPTYPLVDGEYVHYIPLDLGGYVFCRKKDSVDALSALLMHP
jgi:hypothetical protein